jgi:phage I-like protein
VPLQVHSAALTNTPFLTELDSLNEASVRRTGDADAFTSRLKEGDSAMSIVDRVAAALRREPSAGREPPIEVTVANALDLEQNADPTLVANAVSLLKAEADALGAVRHQLGLADDSPKADVLNAIGSLQQEGTRHEAEALVDSAVRGGRIAPAHRDFYLGQALSDLDAARDVINALPVLTARPARAPAPDAAAVSEEERAVCRQLGLTPEQMVDARSN